MSLKNHFWQLLVLGLFLSCSNLSNEEVAKLEHTYSGCFGGGRNKLISYKQAGATFARLETNGKFVRVARLSESQLSAFYSFVEELRHLREVDGCTTVETYKLYTTTSTINRVDGGCGWGGFRNLELILFDHTASPDR